MSSTSLSGAVGALRKRSATTPGNMVISLVITLVLAVLFIGASVNAIHSARSVTQSVGRDSAPSIVAAQQIRSLLAEAQAQAANEVLGGTNSVGARARYEQAISQAQAAIVDASTNVNYPGEADQLKKIEQGIATYTGYVETARANSRQGFPVGAAYMRLATQTLRVDIDGAARELAAINNRQLNETYSGAQRNLLINLALVLVTGLALLGCLVRTQLFVKRNFRRTLNRSLLGGTALQVVFLTWVAVALLASGNHLNTAKTENFDSVHALWNARAIGFDARADQSLYLLKRGGDARYQESFNAKTTSMASTPITDQVLADARSGRVNFEGHLADELRNISLPGEREAAFDALRWYAAYMGVDRQIREHVGKGEYSQAVARSIGTSEGDANFAFERFDSALGQTVAIKQAAFDSEVSSAFSWLAWLDLAGIIVGLLVVVLTWLGLRPRLAEYA